MQKSAVNTELGWRFSDSQSSQASNSSTSNSWRRDPNHATSSEHDISYLKIIFIIEISEQWLFRQKPGCCKKYLKIHLVDSWKFNRDYDEKNFI